MRRIALVVLASALTACMASGRTAVRQQGAAETFPPPQYKTWWKQMERCSGIRAPMERIGFIAMASATVKLEDGQDAGALYQRDFREIWVGKPYWFNRVVVQHEMLHALLATRGIVGHPPEFFGPGSRCGSPVAMAAR